MKSSIPAVLATALGLGATQAATIIENTTPSDQGIPYHWDVTLGATDSATVVGHVGAWSWEDNSLFTPGTDPVGWTHTSHWAAVTLGAPAFFTITMNRQADVPWPSAQDPNRTTGASPSMFPSFTIFSGTDTTGTQNHTWNNHPDPALGDLTGAIGWADPVYLDHIDNATELSITRTWLLPAGSYTVALGSNAPATNTDRQGYQAIFSTSQVPEPGALMLGALAATATLARRRRRA